MNRKRNNKLVLWRIGRDVSAILILIFAFFLYRYTGVKDTPFEKVNAALLLLVDQNEMVDVSDRGLNRYYGLNVADYEAVSMFISQNAMSAEELLLIKVRDESQIKEVETAIKKRVQNRKKDFAGYAPKQEKLLKDSVLMIRGNYVLLAVLKDTQPVIKVFKKNT